MLEAADVADGGQQRHGRDGANTALLQQVGHLVAPGFGRALLIEQGIHLRQQWRDLVQHRKSWLTNNCSGAVRVKASHQLRCSGPNSARGRQPIVTLQYALQPVACSRALPDQALPLATNMRRARTGSGGTHTVGSSPVANKCASLSVSWVSVLTGAEPIHFTNSGLATTTVAPQRRQLVVQMPGAPVASITTTSSG